MKSTNEREGKPEKGKGEFDKKGEGKLANGEGNLEKKREGKLEIKPCISLSVQHGIVGSISVLLWRRRESGTRPTCVS